MRTLSLAWIVVLAAICPVWSQTPPGGSVVGLWEGAINGPVAIQVVVRLDRAQDGGWSGTIDIPAQGARNLPLTGITVEGRAVRFAIAGVAGAPTFVGTLADDDASIAGDFNQGAAKLTFALTRNTTGTPAPTLARPQEPKPPFPYDDDEVTIPTKVEGVTLGGVLTTPLPGRALAVLILISGSGTQDRDETIAGHKPFLLIADYLTRRGFAVLRLDDRGIGRSTGSMAAATSEDLAGDVLAAVEFVKAYQRTSGVRIGLIGHSEGGLIAPMVATRSSDIAFQVLLAGPGVTGERILYAQASSLAAAQGASPAQIAESRTLQERLYAVVKTETDVTVMREKLRAIGGEASARALSVPWFKFFLTHDPAPVLRRVSIPTLALNGERDVQVPFDENLAAINASLRAGGNGDVTVRSFPGLNHLFQTATTGLPAEYGQIEETMAPVVLETIGDWLLARVR